MKLTALVIVAVAAFMDATAGYAHHSFAMFDYAKTLTLEGTVKEFQWTNPHAWLLISARGGDNVEAEWAIEMGTPISLVRQGWQPTSLTPGLKVTALIQPLKNGGHGGRLVMVTLPDGTRKGHPYPLGIRSS
jgi:Family of unknown function (DUF6152)